MPSDCRLSRLASVYAGGGGMGVTGRVSACPMAPRIEIEAQITTALMGDGALGEEM